MNRGNRNVEDGSDMRGDTAIVYGIVTGFSTRVSILLFLTMIPSVS